MSDQPLLLSPSSDGLDRAGWARLSKIADATQSALQEVPETKKPNPAGMLLAEVVAALQRDWHRLWHPLESLREWWSNQAQSGEQYREQGSEHGPKEPTPTPPGKGPSLDATWIEIRDKLFEAAKDAKADPKEVASQIVSAIPAEYHEAIAERLSNLAEIARVSAGMSHPPKIESAPIKEAPEFGEPPPERVPEPPLPSNVRLLPQRPERQVPPQPLPESPVVARALTQPQTQTKAKSR